jgi:hypothetical protein
LAVEIDRLECARVTAAEHQDGVCLLRLIGNAEPLGHIADADGRARGRSEKHDKQKQPAFFGTMHDDGQLRNDEAASLLTDRKNDKN